MKKILITGANGYIGKTLAEALKGSYTVETITRFNVDLLNRFAVRTFFKYKYYDVVIHCAVVGGSRLKEDDVDVLMYNVSMYENLLDCSEHFGKLIHFGSGAEIYAPGTPYGMSKAVIAEDIKVRHGFHNIRIYAVFDENELDTRFIKANLLRYLNKEPMQIYQDKEMDFFYMPDLVELVKYFIEEQITHPFNADCSYKETYKLSEIAAFINTLDDYQVPVQITSEETVAPYKSFEVAPTLKSPYIGLLEGIKRTYNKLKNEAN